MFLTPAECAARLRCSRRHVYDLCKAGILRYFKDGSRLKIHADSLEEYIDPRPEPVQLPKRKSLYSEKENPS
jgi:excisionase family DNA binding protein